MKQLRLRVIKVNFPQLEKEIEMDVLPPKLDPMLMFGPALGENKKNGRKCTCTCLINMQITAYFGRKIQHNVDNADEQEISLSNLLNCEERAERDKEKSVIKPNLGGPNPYNYAKQQIHSGMRQPGGAK
jgi:hypothetical protein